MTDSPGIECDALVKVLKPERIWAGYIGTVSLLTARGASVLMTDGTTVVDLDPANLGRLR